MRAHHLQQLCLAALVWFAADAIAEAAGLAAGNPQVVDRNVLAKGRELFVRIWAPNDARSPNGDGLGPVFNATSCAACHSQGGLGGSGSDAQNVRVISISTATLPNKRLLLHPGFKTQDNLVLHHGSVERRYDAWRDRLVGRAASSESQTNAEEVSPELRIAMKNYQEGLERGAKALASISSAPNPLFGDEPAQNRPRGNWGGGMMMGGGWGATAHARPLVASQPPGTLTVSERNSTALFGAGLIDQIPAADIEAAASLEAKQSPQTAGRVLHLPGNRIGRFGWHAQQASLSDFTLTACAVELGLNVADHPQAGNPLKPKYDAPGSDLTAEECTALVAFLAALPRPTEPRAGAPKVEEGRRVFERIGCADCHLANLGGVTGLYSDLLMHDMGARLRAGAYGAFVPKAEVKAADNSWHGDREWRTPPLWGVASSAPYLHDGRAETLEAALLLHGGQGEASADKFRQLAPAERHHLITFLGSLVAPPGVEKFQIAQFASAETHAARRPAHQPPRVPPKRVPRTKRAEPE